MATAAAPQVSPQQLNAMQRAAVLANAVEMTQVISTSTFNPAVNNVLQIVPRNVGLIKKFIVEIAGNFNSTDATLAGTLTDFGLANILSNISFTDLNNNQRISTTGWHLTMLNSVKSRTPYGSGYPLETDNMMSFSENFGVLVAPPTVAALGNQPFRAMFEIPLCYSDDDLRGAVYANVVNASMQLSLTFNPAPSTAVGVDSTLAIYKGTNKITMNTATVTVSQVYLDQLPVGKGGVVLPVMDLSTIYELKTSPFQSIAVNNEFPVPFANFRDFLSVTAVYDNTTVADTGRTGGTDISYWALQSANFTNIWKISSLLAAQRTRQILGCDLPKGAYYFSFRRKPISTVQYGNMELIMNPTVAAASAQLLVGWEDFALVNTLTSAGSLSFGN
jgi:hypothetical protein